MPPARNYTGQLLALTAAVGYALNAVVVRAFEDLDGDPVTLVLARMVVGIAVFGVAGWLVSRARVTRRLVLLGLGLGVAYALGSACLVLGYANAPASLVVLLFYVYPLLVLVGASTFLGEVLGPRRIALVAVGMTGLVLALGTPSGFSLAGVLLGLGAGVGAAWMILGSRYLLSEGLEVAQILGLIHVAPAVVSVLVVVTGLVALPPSSVEAWGWTAVYAVVCSALPTAFLYSAIRRIGAGLASLIATFEPVVAIVLAYLVLDETLTALQLAGGALVIAAVAALSVLGPPKGASPVAPEPARQAA